MLWWCRSDILCPYLPYLEKTCLPYLWNIQIIFCRPWWQSSIGYPNMHNLEHIGFDLSYLSTNSPVCGAWFYIALF